MRSNQIILGSYLISLLVLLITVVVQTINLKNAKKKIASLENASKVTTVPTTTTQPNLTPSAMSFTTNKWIFDKNLSDCTENIPITINIPVQNPDKCVKKSMLN